MAYTTIGGLDARWYFATVLSAFCSRFLAPGFPTLAILIGGLWGATQAAQASNENPLMGAGATPRIPNGVDLVPQRPGDQRLPLPDTPKTETPPPTFVLPPAPKVPADERLSNQPKVNVKKIKFTGNTVFSDDELSTIAAPYEGRAITSEDLHRLRNAITLYHVNRGYINSGAVIPDQKVTDGEIEFRIIEGTLDAVEVSGTDRLRENYIKKRLTFGSGDVLRLEYLQERVQLLHQDRLIDRVNAELRPGLNPGDSILHVRVDESRWYQVGVLFDNNRSPSVGELQGQAYGSIYNLTGFGDALSARFSYTGGFNNVFASYSFPFTAYDSRFKLYYDHSDADIVEEPFESLLGTKSRTETFGLGLEQPFHLSLRSRLLGSVIVEKRRSKISSEAFSELGIPLENLSPGSRNGRSDLTVLRFLQEWVDRSQNQVLALRSTMNWGINAIDATVNSGDIPDGRFFSWLGQFQWVRRLWSTDIQVLARTDVQLTPDPLLPMEKFGVGGVRTVRGYRANQLVRDEGAIASIEFRFPVFRLPLPEISQSATDGMIQFATFYDFGWSENTEQPSLDFNTISSAGIGLRWDPHSQIHSEFYWGIPFRKVHEGGEHSLQDSGIHFLLNIRAF